MPFMDDIHGVIQQLATTKSKGGNGHYVGSEMITRNAIKQPSTSSGACIYSYKMEIHSAEEKNHIQPSLFFSWVLNFL